MEYFTVEENGAKKYIFALQVDGIAKKPIQVRGTSNVEEWEREQDSWYRKLAAVLVAAPYEKELELRFIGEGAKAKGEFKICLFGRVSAEDKNNINSVLYPTWKDLYAMLHIGRHVYSIKSVKNIDLRSLLYPLKRMHKVELTRAGIDFLHSSSSGFITDAQSGEDIISIPFYLDDEPSDLIFVSRFLAEYPYPLVVSIRATPFTGTLPDLSLYKPAKIEDIHDEKVILALQKFKQLARSKESMCCLRIFISSEDDVTEPVINALGSELLSKDRALWKISEVSKEGETGETNFTHQPNSVIKDCRPIYSINEASRVFRLPRPGNNGVPGIPVANPFLPAKLSTTGAVLGYKQTVDGEVAVRINEADRDKHVYILGQTGTGKTTLMYSMAMSDIREGRGICVIDPHDDLHERLLARIPEHRRDDVILFDPNDVEYPLGLNLLEGKDEREMSFLANELILILRKVYDLHGQGFIGPMFEQAVRNAALTAMNLPGGGTVVDVPVLLTDKKYTEKVLEYITDERLKSFWNDLWFAYKRDYSEILAYVTSKFDNIQADPIIRRIMGQTVSSINLRQVMDEGKILLVNLSKGGLGEMNSFLLGSIMVAQLFTTALSRYDLPADQRKPFCLYIDEFQNFTTHTVHTMLSEARKYRLSLVLAHQNITQLPDLTRETVLGNVGSLIFFRPGAHDANFVQEYLKPYFFEKDLLDMPNWQAIGRILIDAVPSKPFVFQVNKEQSEDKNTNFEYIRDRVRTIYAKPYRQVEEAINERYSKPESLGDL